MNLRLKALHDQLQANINEARALHAKETLTGDEEARMTELTASINDAKTRIEHIKSQDEVIRAADGFLNGGDLKSIVGQMAGADPDGSYLTDKADKVLGRSKFFALAGYSDQQSASKQAHRFGMFMLAGRDAAKGRSNSKAIQYCKQNGIPLAGMTEGVNEDGGFLVPVEFENALIVLRERYGVFRRYSHVRPMSREQKVVFRQTGGLTAYFVDEEDTITESKPGYDRVQLNAKKLAALSYESSEIDEDSMMDLGDILMGEFAYAFAKKEDLCGFAGDGTSTYGRITGVPQRLIDVFTVSGGTGLTLGSGNLWSELTMADFLGVTGSLPEFAEEGNPNWFNSKTFFETVMIKLALASGGVTVAEVAAGAPRRFLGREVVVTQAMPQAQANSQVPTIFGDLSMGSTFGDRRKTTIAWSEHFAFSTDRIAARGTERFDINVHDVGETGTAGPLVGLLTAAS